MQKIAASILTANFASIPQDIVWLAYKIAMAVKTEGSNSETICVHLIKLDSDTKKIAYIYKNSFKDKLNTRSQNQTGAVILTINEFFNAMEGNYFTDGNTKGTVYLSRA